MNPEKIYQVSHTQLSIASFYGSCKYNGDEYIYNPTDDTLTRIDVFNKEKGEKRVKNKTPFMKFSNYLEGMEK